MANPLTIDEGLVMGGLRPRTSFIAIVSMRPNAKPPIKR